MKEGLSSEMGARVHDQLRNPEVTAQDIDATLPEIEGTKIIIQRHERYVRKVVDEATDRLGGLTEDSARNAYEQSRRILDEMLSAIDGSEEEIEFLVVGSNTRFMGEGQRSMETARQVLQALKDELAERGIDKNQILNNRSKRKEVAEIPRTQAPRIFDDSPEYVQFLEDKYGVQTQAFWKAFEEDTHKAERLGFGAEGPDDMDQRFAGYLQTLSNFSDRYHKMNPGKRLVVWSVSHYDTVSPFIKRHITDTDPHQFVAIDYGAGVSIDIDPEGKVTSNFQGKTHDVNLT